MKVLICDKISDKGIEALTKAGFEVDSKTGLPPEELLKIVAPYDVIVVRSATKITKDVIDAAKNLKLVVRGGVGLDNVDGEYAKTKNIKVRNTPDASTESVAELVMALFLALCRNVVKADASMKKGEWEKKAFEGIELFEKTLGIIGTGRIGQSVAKKGKLAFDMKVIGYDPYADKAALSKAGIESTGLDDLLQRSDFISFHLPLTPESKNMISDAQFGKMKKGVVIVNCSRGGVVSESALIKALDEGIVAGAAVDVFEKEPLDPASALRKHDKLILTPHLGASSKEGQARVSAEVAKVIIAEIK
jgi:D-3-phosphoglycerate dehydrogenase / 2-oxoglutarate reductase